MGRWVKIGKIVRIGGKRVLVGDTIAGITKAFGVKPCKGCEKRRQLLNRYGFFVPTIRRTRSE